LPTDDLIKNTLDRNDDFMIDMLPEAVINHRKNIGVPDEIYMFEWCPNCSQVPIKRLEVRIDRSNEENIDTEIVQKSFIIQILDGFLEPYRNSKQCDCSFAPTDKKLFQAVLCCEKEAGRIDKHYYIDFLHNNIEEMEYERVMEFDIDWLKFFGAIEFENNQTKKETPLPHYIFIDTETTGLPLDYNAPVTNSHNWPRMVQICWLEFDINGNEISSNDYIIKPNGYQIPLSSTHIHNITQASALSTGHDLKAVLSNFSNRIQKAQVLVGHNIDFDLNIIGAELHRMNIGNPFSSKNKLCTMKSTKEICAISNAYGYKFPTLQELHHKLFKSVFTGSHNALNDIKATSKCFWELKRLGKI